MFMLCSTPLLQNCKWCIICPTTNCKYFMSWERRTSKKWCIHCRIQFKYCVCLNNVSVLGLAKVKYIIYRFFMTCSELLLLCQFVSSDFEISFNLLQPYYGCNFQGNILVYVDMEKKHSNAVKKLTGIVEWNFFKLTKLYLNRAYEIIYYLAQCNFRIRN